jgi:ribosomal protein L37AE/L43A
MVEFLLDQKFRRRARPDGAPRGLPGYFALNHEERPDWWRGDLVSGGEVLGVYEATPSCAEGAIVFTPEEVIVLGDPGVHVRYDEVASFGVPSKEPISPALETILVTGERIELPVAGQTGAIFGIMRFLQDAKLAFERREDTSPHTCPHCHQPGTRFRICEGTALICPTCGRSFDP